MVSYNLKLKEVVEKLLKEEKRCRHDNKWLTYRVMRHYTKIFIPFQDFLRIPSFESIAKCRRDIMNKEGKFNDPMPDEEGITYEKPRNFINSKEVKAR